MLILQRAAAHSRSSLYVGHSPFALSNDVHDIALPSIQRAPGISQGMLPWIVNAYVFAFAACCCSEDASATCLVGDGSRPWLPLVGRSRRLDLGILELAHLRAN